MRTLVKSIYRRIFPLWPNSMGKELLDCQVILDLGCSKGSSLHYHPILKSIGVDMFKPYLEENKAKGIYSDYILADFREIEFKEKSVDAVIAIDILEHLTKSEGAELLDKIERWAKKKIILTTPNGYLYQATYDNNPLQEHKSGWHVTELRKLDYSVFGLSGWKRLRGYKGLLKYKPNLLWAIISDLTQKITYYYPRLAFQLYAIKRINDR